MVGSLQAHHHTSAERVLRPENSLLLGTALVPGNLQSAGTSGWHEEDQLDRRLMPTYFLRSSRRPLSASSGRGQRPLPQHAPAHRKVLHFYQPAQPVQRMEECFCTVLLFTSVVKLHRAVLSPVDSLRNQTYGEAMALEKAGKTKRLKRN